MRTWVLVLAALLAIAATAGAVIEGRREVPPAPVTAAVPIPPVVAPAAAPAPAAAATKATPRESDLPTVAVGDHPVHVITESAPTAVMNFTFSTPDGRAIGRSHDR